MGEIKTALDARKELGEGISVLSSDEWLDLSAFTDNAIYFNPSTEKMLRAAINLKPSEKLVPEFEATIQKYLRLKQYCQTFSDEILPGTRELASSVIQYARDAAATYKALTRALVASSGPAVDISLAEALTELSKQWKSLHPSADAQVARGKFAKYIGILKGDAELRERKAIALHTALLKFHADLKASNAEFVADAKNYESLFGALNPKVKRLKDALKSLQDELTGMRKQEGDFVVVLATAPAYLAIPFFGWFIMAGVLSGVGGALGTLRRKIGEKLQEAEKLGEELGPKEKFMSYYQYGQDTTFKTAKEVEAAAVLVKKVSDAWGKITSDLTDLNTRLLASANESSLAGDWDIAGLRLETASQTWQDLKVDAEQYLRHQLRRADDLDDAMKGVVEKSAA